MDNTFGIQVVYQKTPQGPRPDNSPKSGLQFFGEVAIEAQTENLTVHLRDVSGASLFSRTLEPRRN
ncbi:hypothetical protein D3C83_234860 [compost metagenome]